MLLVFLMNIFNLLWIKGEKEIFQIIGLANLSYLKCLVSSTADTNSIVQEPPFIIKRSSESVDGGIRCSHSIRDYDFILWYKQEELGALKLLGYLNVNFVKLEDDVKGKILFDGHGSSKSDLTIYNLTFSDSGVYFCAVSQHSAAGGLKVCTRTVSACTKATCPPTKTCSSADSGTWIFSSAVYIVYRNFFNYMCVCICRDKCLNVLIVAVTRKCLLGDE